MTRAEADQLDDIFRNLDENDGTPDTDMLDALTKLSLAGKAEFVRRMDERFGVQPPQTH